MLFTFHLEKRRKYAVYLKLIVESDFHTAFPSHGYCRLYWLYGYGPEIFQGPYWCL